VKHPSHKLPIQELLPVVGGDWDRHGAPPTGRNSQSELDVSHCDPPGSGSPPTAHVLAHETQSEPAIPWTATDPPTTRGRQPPGWRESSGSPPGRITSRGDPPGSGSPPTAHVLAHEAQSEPAIPWTATDPPTTRGREPPGWRESSGSPPGRITSRGDPPGSGSPPTTRVLAHEARAEPAIPWSVTDPPPGVLEPPGRREPSGAPPGRISSRGDPPGGGGIGIQSLSAERRWGLAPVTRPEAVRHEAVRTLTPKSRKIRPWL